MNPQWKVVLSIALISLISARAEAGAEKGNGGGAFVCRAPNGAILSAELVDFVEGRAEYGLTIPKTNSPVDDQINRALMRMLSGAPDLAGRLQESIENVRSIMNVSDEIRLENTNDFNLRVVPRNCAGGVTHFEQLANYTDDGRLVVDGEIHARLSTTDQAALIVHEAAYLLARDWHDAISSREARRLTAHLFSNKDPKQIAGTIYSMDLIDPQSNAIWTCTSVVGITEALFCDNCSDPHWFVRENSNIQVIAGSGSTRDRAASELESQFQRFQRGTNSSSDDRYVVLACGHDSMLKPQVTHAAPDFNWACDRVFSPELDCKKN